MADRRSFTAAQWAILFLALPGGFLIGLITGFVQASKWTIGSVPIPWGIAASVFLIWVAVRLPSYEVRSRLVGLLVMIGWLIATIMLAIKTPAGDQVLVGDTQSLVYISIGAVTVGVAAGWPLRFKTAKAESVATGVIADDAPATPVAAAALQATTEDSETQH